MNRQILDAFNFRLLSNGQKFNDSKNFTVAKVEAYHSVATEMTAAIAMKQSCVRGYHVYKDAWAAAWIPFFRTGGGRKPMRTPPWNLIGQVLKKAEEQAVDLVLVAPVWPSQPWYPKLLSLLIAQPLRILNPPEEVLHQVWEGLLPEITPPLAMWHISGNTKQTREF